MFCTLFSYGCKASTVAIRSRLLVYHVGQHDATIAPSTGIRYDYPYANGDCEDVHQYPRSIRPVHNCIFALLSCACRESGNFSQGNGCYL